MPTLVASPDFAPDRVRPLLRAEYDELVEAGRFEDERIELLRGTLVEMSPQKPRHASVVMDLSEILFSALAGRGRVRAQLPLAATDDSEPEPDIAVVPPGDYRAAHPTTAWLVIEVAESSLRKDRGIKAAIYAEAAVPEYWVIDLATGQVHVYRDPVDGGYRDQATHGRDAVLQPSSIPGLSIAVTQILPRS